MTPLQLIAAALGLYGWFAFLFILGSTARAILSLATSGPLDGDLMAPRGGFFRWAAWGLSCLIIGAQAAFWAGALWWLALAIVALLHGVALHLNNLAVKTNYHSGKISS